MTHPLETACERCGTPAGVTGYCSWRCRDLHAVETKNAHYRATLASVSTTKLRILADWFDVNDQALLLSEGETIDDEVQRELRRWADAIDAALDERRADLRLLDQIDEALLEIDESLRRGK